ncbi:hypothetical protein F383_23966 [Gossypium arboreum]|jgi:hypothetical protein
MKQY